MRIDIHISEIHVHMHADTHSNLQPEIDKLTKLTADEVAKTQELQTAVDAARGQVP